MRAFLATPELCPAPAPPPTRRAVLAGAAFAPLSTLPLPLPLTPHPDAALLDAWTDWIAATRADDAFWQTTDADVTSPHAAAIADALTRLHGIPARTMAGALVKLRWLWLAQRGTLTAYRVFVYGDPLSPEDRADWMSNRLWTVIADLERMEAGHAP